MSRRSILFTACFTLLTGSLYLSSTTKLKAELVESAQMKWDKRVAELKAAGFDYDLVNHIIALDAEAKGKRLIDDPWLGERLDENAPHKLPDFHSHLKEGISLASKSHEKWREFLEMPEQTERLVLFQHAKEQYLRHQAEITLAQKAIDNADSLGSLSKYNPLTPESHQGKAVAALFTSFKNPISLHSLFLNLSRIEMELGNIEQSKAYLATAQKQRSLYLNQSHSLISLTVPAALTLGESYYLVYLSTTEQAHRYTDFYQLKTEIDLLPLFYDSIMTEARLMSSWVLDIAAEELFEDLKTPVEVQQAQRLDFSRITLDLFDPILLHNYKKDSPIAPKLIAKQKKLANDPNYSKLAKEYLESTSDSFKSYEKHLIKTQASLHITRLSIACNLFHREHASYPKNLDELVPRYLPNLSTIPYTQEAYTYELRPDQRPLINASLPSGLEANSDKLYR